MFMAVETVERCDCRIDQSNRVANPIRSDTSAQRVHLVVAQPAVDVTKRCLIPDRGIRRDLSTGDARRKKNTRVDCATASFSESFDEQIIANGDAEQCYKNVEGGHPADIETTK